MVYSEQAFSAERVLFDAGVRGGFPPPGCARKENAVKNTDIECFITVAEAGGFSRAAELLYTSQSVVSKKILSLENEIGLQLFDRENRHRVLLTDAGKVMYDHFKATLAAYHAALEEARLSQNAAYGCLAIGCSDYDRLQDAEKAADRLREEYPNATVSLEFRLLPFTEQELLDDQYDILITDYDETAKSPRCCYRCLRQVETCIRIAKIHPLAAMEPLTIADMVDEIFYLPANAKSPALPLRQLRQVSALYHVELPNILLTPDIETMERFVRQGRGVTACRMSESLKDPGTFRYIPLDIRQPLGIIWSAAGLSKLGKRFIDEYAKLHNA